MALQLYKMQPNRKITIRGNTIIQTIHGVPHIVFSTNPRDIVYAVKEKFPYPKHPSKDDIYLKLDNAIYQLTVAKDIDKMTMYLSGDMVVYPPNAASVDAVEALMTAGEHCGAYLSTDNCLYRIHYSQIPVPALELQSLLDEENDRWDTLEILTTDPDVIEAHKAFLVVIDYIKKQIGKEPDI